MTSFRDKFEHKNKVEPTNRFKHLSRSSINLLLGYESLECETKETGRKYTTPEGKAYPSITTVLSHFKKKGLENWREFVGKEYADKYTAIAASRGEAVHSLLEDYINNKTIDPKNPWIKTGFSSIRNVLDTSLDRVYCQEVPLYSDYYEVAGRVDLIGEWCGERAVIDFKTSYKPKKKEYCDGYFMQEAFYAIAWEERTGIPVKKLVTLVAVDGENKPTIFIEDRDVWAPKLVKLINRYKDEVNAATTEED